MPTAGLQLGVLTSSVSDQSVFVLSGSSQKYESVPVTTRPLTPDPDKIILYFIIRFSLQKKSKGIKINKTSKKNYLW